VRFVSIVVGSVFRLRALLFVPLTNVSFLKLQDVLAEQFGCQAHVAGLDSRQQQLQPSKPGGYRNMAQAVPAIPKFAHCWAREMEKIARTFSYLRLTPNIYTKVPPKYSDSCARKRACEHDLRNPNREYSFGKRLSCWPRVSTKKRPEPQDRNSGSQYPLAKPWCCSGLDREHFPAVNHSAPAAQWAGTSTATGPSRTVGA
jgi:hypothetical protein